MEPKSKLERNAYTVLITRSFLLEPKRCMRYVVADCKFMAQSLALNIVCDKAFYDRCNGLSEHFSIVYLESFEIQFSRASLPT